MGDQLKPDTSEKMRALCKKISVAHNLDAEIQEELYAHMKDKLLGYLNGKGTLVEADALLLVREHFGEPSRVKALFQEVHRYETNVSLFRRLAAAMIVTMTVFFCVCLGAEATLLPLATWDSRVLTTSLAMGLLILAAVLPWLLLWRYQRRLDMGQTPWFLTWRPEYLAGSIAALFALLLVVQIPLTLANSEPALWKVSPRGFWMLIAVIVAGYPVPMCMTWLWWCDRPPRQPWAVGTAAGCWVIWVLLLSATDGIVKLAFPSSTAPPPSIMASIALTLAVAVACAFIACTLYKAGQYTRSHTLAKRS